MKKIILTIIVLLGIALLIGFYATQTRVAPPNQLEILPKHSPTNLKNDALEEGDIIFQTSGSGQSEAIQLATHSPYSHCGIVYQTGGEFFVFEAIQPVSLTPLKQWITRGEGERFIVRRLKNAARILTPGTLQKMKAAGEPFKGKDYDSYFEWSDDKIYCSELIWKIFKTATGLEIGKLEKLKDFDLTHPIVQQKMKERYAGKIPLDEWVISPKSIFESDLLETVISK